MIQNYAIVTMGIVILALVIILLGELKSIRSLTESVNSLMSQTPTTYEKLKSALRATLKEFTENNE